MENLTNYITVQNLTLLFSIITPLLLVYYKFTLDKKISKESYNLKELFELHNKMHDRLVESEDAIKTGQYIPEETRKRLRYNASRLKRHDKSIWQDVTILINSWTDTMLQKELRNIKDGDVSKAKFDMINLIEKIKSKIDKTLD